MNKESFDKILQDLNFFHFIQGVLGEGILNSISYVVFLLFYFKPDYSASTVVSASAFASASASAFTITA